MTWMNLSQYGRIRGVSSQAVKNAIAGGRLKNSARQKPNGKWEVNPEMANLEWELNTDSTRRFNVGNPALKYKSDVPTEPYLKPGVDRSLPQQDETKRTLAEAILMKETYTAERAKLRFEIESGKYVEAEKVKADAFKLARGVRDSLLNIPDRVSAEFAGISVPAEIHMRLTDEIRIALEALQDEQN